MDFEAKTRTTQVGSRPIHIITVSASRDEAEEIAAEWRHFGQPCWVCEISAEIAAKYQSDDAGIATLTQGGFAVYFEDKGHA